uniref:Guanine nucleotide exchange factor MSS4 homolog n=1 Tax=Strigamia maritima TaxID=126957 RepID=T1JNP8_STRMM
MDINNTSIPESDNDEGLIKNGRNALIVRCQRCQSSIIRPGKAVYVLKQHFLPYMKPKTDSNDPAGGEVIPKFWQVDDIYEFENVGFSNTVGSTKYLTCADCEIGPIGIHDTSSKISYVALDRVKYQ